MPGVQKPHCEPWCSTIARWIGAETLRGCQAFDRDDVRAIELIHCLEASDRRCDNADCLRRGARPRRCTPAVSFSTTNFGAKQPAPLSEEFDQSHEDIVANDFDPLSVQVDEDMIPHFIDALEPERGGESIPSS